MPRVYRLDKLEMPDILAMEPKMRKKVMRVAAKVARDAARSLTPVRSGKLKKALTYNVDRGGKQGKVKAPKAKAPHAHLVHDGTKPHDIYAKTPESARAGWRYYRNSTETPVHHPGAKAQPFLVEAGEEARPEIERAMLEKANEVLAEVAEGQ